MKNHAVHFYLFKGDWLDVLVELDEMFSRTGKQRFSIWKAIDKTKRHNLIIVYGKPLNEEYFLRKGIWRTDETIFNSFYKNRMEQFQIYGSNELNEPVVRNVA